jgi:hypothetical protein
MRLQVVITVESVSELHRPRLEDHPTRPPHRQLHIGFDGLQGREVHLILANEAASDLFNLLCPIMAEDRGES